MFPRRDIPRNRVSHLQKYPQNIKETNVTIDEMTKKITIINNSYDRIVGVPIINKDLIIPSCNLKNDFNSYIFIINLFYNMLQENTRADYIEFYIYRCNKIYNSIFHLSQIIQTKFNTLEPPKNCKSHWNICANVLNTFLLIKHRNFQIPYFDNTNSQISRISQVIVLEDDNNRSINISSRKGNIFTGTVRSKLTGDAIYAPNNNSDVFEPIRQALIGGLTINEFRIHNPKLYGNVSYLSKEMILIHGVVNPCIILQEDKKVFLERLIHKIATRIPIDSEKEESRYVVFGQKKKGKEFIDNGNPNSIRCKCPCILSIKVKNLDTRTINEKTVECNKYFNFDDTKSRENLFEIFSKYDEPDIIYLLERIRFLFSPQINNFKRLTPTCPSCATKFNNPAAFQNLDGDNPEIYHPTAVTCPECNHGFCTDCEESHIGSLCNGYSGTEEDRDWNIQKCPGCSEPSFRTGGCSVMICKRELMHNDEKRHCGVTWCWICRCIRKHEYCDPPHYCIIDDNIARHNDIQYFPRWTDNPVWINDIHNWRDNRRIFPLTRNPL